MATFEHNAADKCAYTRHFPEYFPVHFPGALSNTVW